MKKQTMRKTLAALLAIAAVAAPFGGMSYPVAVQRVVIGASAADTGYVHNFTENGTSSSF